ncbi:MAG: hypothetical protein ACJAWL_003090 [Motiliproteus sp.]|jgi:hypothetical protein
MLVTRRKFLSLVGGGVVVAAAASTATFLATRTPHKALAPWDNAGSYNDPRLRAMSYALLAPNPHNRQPWIAELVGTNGVTLYRDKQRDLPVTDPFGRQLMIGMGCFTELMRMAAAEQGYGLDTVLMPEGEDGPIARCIFVEGKGKADPLFQHVMNRRSHKELFEKRDIDVATAQQLSGFTNVYPQGYKQQLLSQIAHAAWLTEASTPNAWQESVDLLRIGKSEINASPDGIDVGGPVPDTLALLGLFTREAAADLNSQGSRDAIKSTANAILSAPAFTLNITPGNTRADQLEAGRQWLRLNLKTTSLGLALRPVSQALQEYDEMKPHRDRLHREFSNQGGTVQMLGLLGYGALTERTPRWPIETRLINA